MNKVLQKQPIPNADLRSAVPGRCFTSDMLPGDAYAAGPGAALEEQGPELVENGH